MPAGRRSQAEGANLVVGRVWRLVPARVQLQLGGNRLASFLFPSPATGRRTHASPDHDAAASATAFAEAPAPQEQRRRVSRRTRRRRRGAASSSRPRAAATRRQPARRLPLPPLPLAQPATVVSSSSSSAAAAVAVGSAALGKGLRARGAARPEKLLLVFGRGVGADVARGLVEEFGGTAPRARLRRTGAHAGEPHHLLLANNGPMSIDDNGRIDMQVPYYCTYYSSESICI
ncbi:uncharacterized protein LOC127762147 isoform X3 [Oryza glaberrima]|uniref:uncharacterized protein LOC127762147 isoform X3 n=1 Tax=Oryza glaberrima TaxID=4538 RepID=UPI00224C548B|nr:uncharacterized protein LOC127762147 isoform X3 [Oryza glaberrima]